MARFFGAILSPLWGGEAESVPVFSLTTTTPMAFIVLDKTYKSDSKVRYIQFGDECATIGEALKLAQFPNLRDPIIVNLDQVRRPPAKLKLT